MPDFMIFVVEYALNYKYEKKTMKYIQYLIGPQPISILGYWQIFPDKNPKLVHDMKWVKCLESMPLSTRCAFYGGPQNRTVESRKRMEINIKTRPNKNIITAN